MQKPTPPGHRLGLMGGTFNPVHLGHLRAAEEIAEKFKLDKVCFMPSASPPHKSSSPFLLDFEHRLEMLKLAVSDRPGFEVSDLENKLPFPSYTVNTVKAFRKTLEGQPTIYFIVGLDSFLTMAQWSQCMELLAQTSFVVFARAGISDPWQSLQDMLLREVSPEIRWHPETQMFTAPDIQPIHYQSGGRLAISSTELRQKLENGASVRYLVPELVRAYINKGGFYKK